MPYNYDKIYEKIMEKFKDTDAKNPIDHFLIKEAFKKRKPEIYKGSCGSLAICAGSPGLTGAACMAADSALRGGCGLVTLICAKELEPIFEIKLTEAMTKSVKSGNGIIKASAFNDICDILKGKDVLLYGPGLTCHKDVKILLKKIIKNTDIPLVIDADGLNVLKGNTDILKMADRAVILTPHIGEFARLTGYDRDYILQNQKRLCLEFSKEYNVITVLKSHRTVVSDGKTVYENILGNPGMATGGCGDVLSGLIASFLAQGTSPLLSALAGVYIHSLAADMATASLGEYALLPRDIISHIAYATKETSLKA